MHVRPRRHPAWRMTLRGEDLLFHDDCLWRAGEGRTKLGGRLQKRLLDAPRLGDEREDEDGGPVGQEDQPVQPGEGLERLVLAAEARESASGSPAITKGITAKG